MESSSDENSEIWRVLLNTRPQIHMRNPWKYKVDFMYYDTLRRIEKNKYQLEFDVFRLIGFFVEFGLKLFNGFLEHRIVTNEEHSFSRLVKKYEITDCDPKHELFCILHIVQRYPHYVAEHLNRGNSPIWDVEDQNLEMFPRSLAFNGGLLLIPHGPEWKPLAFLWRNWHNIYCTKIRKENSYETLTYRYIDYAPITDAAKYYVMSVLKIDPSALERS